MEFADWRKAHLDMLAISAYCRARSKNSRMPKQEPLLALNPQIAYLYSLKVVRGRFKMAERSIAKDPEWAVRYARFVLKGRFKLAERRIARNTRYAYEYATKVVRGKLPDQMRDVVASMVPDYFAEKYLQFEFAKSK